MGLITVLLFFFFILTKCQGQASSITAIQLLIVKTLSNSRVVSLYLCPKELQGASGEGPLLPTHPPGI